MHVPRREELGASTGVVILVIIEMSAAGSSFRELRKLCEILMKVYERFMNIDACLNSRKLALQVLLRGCRLRLGVPAPGQAPGPA